MNFLFFDFFIWVFMNIEKPKFQYNAKYGRSELPISWAYCFERIYAVVYANLCSNTLPILIVRFIKNIVWGFFAGLLDMVWTKTAHCMAQMPIHCKWVLCAC